MFTGIVEDVGTVVSAETRGDVRVVRVASSVPLDGIRDGASLAVSGCCLTVVAASGREMTFELTAETLARTAFGARLTPGAVVNLERALRADGRFDGHIVQGHVDGVGTIRSLQPTGAAALLVVAAPPEVERYLVEKGSVAVDGISLTVAARGAGDFTVAIIPFTLERTTLRAARAGDRVNLEADVVAKYVERLLPPSAADTRTGTR
jgi:riboflavin synthase